MASFSLKLKKILLQSSKSSQANLTLSPSKYETTAPSIKIDHETHRFPSKTKSSVTQVTQLENYLSMNTLNTFLVKNPQMIQKEKQRSYMNIFKSGKMKDLHREYFNELTMSPMHNNHKQKKVLSQKAIKENVESYINEIREESKLNGLKMLCNDFNRFNHSFRSKALRKGLLINKTFICNNMKHKLVTSKTKYINTTNKVPTSLHSNRSLNIHLQIL